ncbi:MAG: SIS domain-containing protein [Eubacterium sp.]|nr:SIS domain-containing protein [Eubacterium sp.]
MEKDMRYYVQITGDRMLDNIEKSHELTEELIKEYELFREKSNNSDICIVASGSSLNAALSAFMFIKHFSGVNVEIISAGDCIDYNQNLIQNSFVILVSQSGCSTNMIQVAKRLNDLDRPFVVLTGNVEAELSRYSDCVIEYGVGNEIIDYVTLGFSTLILYFMLFSLEIGRKNKTISGKYYTKIRNQMKKACEINCELANTSDEWIHKWFYDFLAMEKVIIVADGANMGIAREAALKFQETLKVLSAYYEREEYIHGPNMQLTPAYSVFFIDTNPNHNRMYDVYEATRLVTKNVYYISNKNEITERGLCIEGNSSDRISIA